MVLGCGCRMIVLQMILQELLDGMLFWLVIALLGVGACLKLEVEKVDRCVAHVLCLFSRDLGRVSDIKDGVCFRFALRCVTTTPTLPCH